MPLTIDATNQTSPGTTTTGMSPLAWNKAIELGILKAVQTDELTKFVDFAILNPEDNHDKVCEGAKDIYRQALSRDNLSLLGAQLASAQQINDLSDFTNAKKEFHEAILRNPALDSLIPALERPLLFELLKNSEEDTVNEKIINTLLADKKYVDSIITSESGDASKNLAIIANKATTSEQCKTILSDIKRNGKKLEEIPGWESIAKGMLKTKNSTISIFNRFDITEEPGLDIKDKIAFAKKIDNSKQLINLAANLDDMVDAQVLKVKQELATAVLGASEKKLQEAIAADDTQKIEAAQKEHLQAVENLNAAERALEEALSKNQDTLIAAQEIIKNSQFNAQVAEKLFEHPNIIKNLEATDLQKLALHTSNSDHFRQILNATHTNSAVVDKVIAQANPKPTGLNKLFDRMANYFPKRRLKYPTWSRKNWWQKPLFALGQAAVQVTLPFLKLAANTVSLMGNLLIRPRKTVNDLVSGRFVFPFSENPSKLLEEIAPDISKLDKENKVAFSTLGSHSQTSLVSCESIDSTDRKKFHKEINTDFNYGAAPAVSPDLHAKFAHAAKAIGPIPPVEPPKVTPPKLSGDAKTKLYQHLNAWLDHQSADSKDLVSVDEPSNSAIFSHQETPENQEKQAKLFVEAAKIMVEKIQEGKEPKEVVELTAASFKPEMVELILTKLESTSIPGLKINIPTTDPAITARINKINEQQEKALVALAKHATPPLVGPPHL